jgi:hypothetical protein
LSSKSTSSDDNDNYQKISVENKNEFKDKLLLIDHNDFNSDNKNNNINNNNIVFKSKNKSRFFNNNNYVINNNDFNNYKIIIDNVLTKYPLYSISYKKNSVNMKKYEYNFCLKLYHETKDIEILKIIKKMY